MSTTTVLTAEDLSVVPALQGLPDEVLSWLIAHGEVRNEPIGAELFHPGDSADYLIILLRGTIQLWREQNGQMEPTLRMEAPVITGLLPYSRLRQTPALAVIAEEAQLLMLHRDKFAEMEQASPDLVQRLVGVMSDRVREEARNLERDDKLRALGKLSAGLAHELNNPVAAIGRAADSLLNNTAAEPQLLTELLAHQLPAEVWPELLALASRTALPSASLSALEQADCEDEMIDWLEQQGIDDASGMVTGLLAGGLEPTDLRPIMQALPVPARSAAVRWLEGQLTNRQLVRDVQQATHRITELVRNVKEYSHMDRASGRMPTDLHAGLDSTLMLLSYPLRKHRVKVVRSYAPGLVLVNAQPNALNQVWTNLIDNAIDVLPDEGELTIATSSESSGVCVSVIDNGPGIPPDVLPHIFEPFYTTKGVGEGSGMGLDIVRRIVQNHNGRVQVHSVPGRTEFNVWLPLAQ
jgi:signal transduction histidine kinase